MPHASAIGELHGRVMVITRPAGTAATFARLVRRQGGVPLLLPGLALRAVDDVAHARSEWQIAQARDDVLVFTSPAAVRFAARLAPLQAHGCVLAVGQGTVAVLRRYGVQAQAPRDRQDSEGLLELLPLHTVQGRRVALIGAAGGRGLLQTQLLARGARLHEVSVYRRTPARLDRRHFGALEQLPADACVLLSSAQALAHLQQALPAPAWQRICRAVAVASSERLATAASAAGFAQVRRAASAAPADLLAAAAGSVR